MFEELQLLYDPTKSLAIEGYNERCPVIPQRFDQKFFDRALNHFRGTLVDGVLQARVRLPNRLKLRHPSLEPISPVKEAPYLNTRKPSTKSAQRRQSIHDLEHQPGFTIAETELQRALRQVMLLDQVLAMKEPRPNFPTYKNGKVDDEHTGLDDQVKTLRSLGTALNKHEMKQFPNWTEWVDEMYEKYRFKLFASHVGKPLIAAQVRKQAVEISIEFGQKEDKKKQSEQSKSSSRDSLRAELQRFHPRDPRAQEEAKRKHAERMRKYEETKREHEENRRKREERYKGLSQWRLEKRRFIYRYAFVTQRSPPREGLLQQQRFIYRYTMAGITRFPSKQRERWRDSMRHSTRSTYQDPFPGERERRERSQGSVKYDPDISYQDRFMRERERRERRQSSVKRSAEPTYQDPFSAQFPPSQEPMKRGRRGRKQSSARPEPPESSQMPVSTYQDPFSAQFPLAQDQGRREPKGPRQSSVRHSTEPTHQDPFSAQFASKQEQKVHEQKEPVQSPPKPKPAPPKPTQKPSSTYEDPFSAEFPF